MIKVTIDNKDKHVTTMIYLPLGLIVWAIFHYDYSKLSGWVVSVEGKGHIYIYVEGKMEVTSVGVKK